MTRWNKDKHLGYPLILSNIKSRWIIHNLTQKVDRWHYRSHGKVDYHMIQELFRHGCFAAYSHRFSKLVFPACWYYDTPVDDAYHTIFECDPWHNQRLHLNTFLQNEITTNNIVNLMLQSKADWDAVKISLIKFSRRRKKGTRRHFHPS